MRDTEQSEYCGVEKESLATPNEAVVTHVFGFIGIWILVLGLALITYSKFDWRGFLG